MKRNRLSSLVERPKSVGLSRHKLSFELFLFSATYVVWLIAHITAFQSLGWFISNQPEALAIPLWGVLASFIVTILFRIFHVFVSQKTRAEIAQLLSTFLTVLLALALLLFIHRSFSHLPWIPRRVISMFGLIELGFLVVVIRLRASLSFSSYIRLAHFLCVCGVSAGGLMYVHASHMLAIFGFILALLSLVVGFYPVVASARRAAFGHESNVAHALVFFLTAVLVVIVLRSWSIVPFDFLNKTWMPTLVEDRKSMIFLTLATIVIFGGVRFLGAQPLRPDSKKTVVDWPATGLIAFGLTLVIVDQGTALVGLFLVFFALIQLIGYNCLGIFPAINATRFIAACFVSVFLLGLCLIAAEAALMITRTQFEEPTQRTVLDEDGKGSSTAHSLVMPTEWEIRKADVEGAHEAYYWHGKLHIKNRHGMRTIGDYEIDPDLRRIVVLGDSVTYGLGIDEKETYSAQLEELLNRHNPAEPTKVYNLGVIALNSDQIAKVAQRWIPKLNPNRVIYGLCLNDFEDWDGEPYLNNMRWSLPPVIAEPMVDNTLLGNLLSRGYNQFLMQIGIRQDFYQDIFENISGRADRLGRDVSRINDLALKYTGKPLLVLVVAELDRSEDARRLTMIAEQQAERGGAEIIPTTEYIEKFGDSYADLKVSPWEGHPNATANRIWAGMIFNSLVQ